VDLGKVVVLTVKTSQMWLYCLVSTVKAHGYNFACNIVY